MRAKQKQSLRELAVMDSKKLLHELGTHRIELEMQNEELRRAHTEIDSTHRKYADLYDFSPVGYFTFDRNGLVREVNNTGARMLGLKKQSLIARQFTSFVEPESRAVFRDHLVEVFGTSGRQNCEITLREKNGTLLPVQLQSIGVEGWDGTINSCRTAVGDISERRQAEAAFRRSEERFRVAQELSLDAFTILDAVRDERGAITDFRWVYVNPEAGRILRHQPEELTGRRLLDVLPGNRTESDLFDQYVRVVETGEPHDYEVHYQADGIDGWFRNMTVKLGDGIAISFTDITARKEAEEVQGRLAAIVASADDAIIGNDLNGIIRTWNAGAENIFGYKAEEVIGRPVSLLVPPGRADEAAAILARIKRREHIGNFETERIGKDGTIIPVSLKFSAIRDAGGTIIGVSKIARDISERRRYEQEIRQRSAELEKARDEAVNERRLLMAVLEALPVGMAITDIRGGTILANNAFEQIWGGPRPDTQSIADYEAYKAWWADTGKPVAPGEWASAIAVRKGEMVAGQMMRIQRFDGFHAFVINSASPVRNAGGTIIGSAVAIQDVTEIKRAEEALRASELKLSTLINAADESIWLFGTDGTVLAANTTAARRVGMSVDEVRGRKVVDLIPAQLAASRQQRLDEVARTRRPVYFADERAGIIFEHSLYPVQDKTGAVTAVAAFSRDITERRRAEETLRRTVAELGEAQRITHIGSWRWDAETDATTGSEELLRIYGLDPATQSMPDFREQKGRCYPEADWERLNAAVQRTLQTGVGYELDVRALRGNALIWITTRGEIVRDPSGRITGLRGSVQDITERKLAEEALLQSEEKYRLIVETAHEGIWITDAGRNTIFVNQRMADMLGVTREEMLGKTSAAFLVTGQEQIVQAAREELKAGKAIQREWRFHRKDGSDLWVIASAAPVLDAEGGFRGTIAMLADITERKQAEEALRRSEERLRYHVENSPLAVVEWDADLNVTRWAGEAEKIFGWSAAETVGKPIMNLRLIFEDDLPIVLQTIEKLTRGLSPHVVSTNRNYTKDGRVITCTWYNSVLQDAAGRMKSAMSQILDITERIRAEEALRTVHAELEQRAYELAAINRQLESFSYTVSHDLKAPLRSIEGFTRALQEEYADRLDATGRDYLLRTISASRRMTQLIEAMLNMARLTRGELHEKTVDLSSLAMIITHDLRKDNPDRRVEFVIADGIKANGDGTMLRVLLENLFHNAWKFTSRHETARIEFGSVTMDGRMVYFVRDDGAGFDMRYADKLFMPFNRFHGASEFPGIGIGLAIAHRIVLRHNGRLWAESAPEKGATFSFTL